VPRRPGHDRVPSGPERVQRLLLSLWSRTRLDWGFASARLAGTLREERGLGSHERRQVAETLYGMIRQARRIDFALEGQSRRLPAGQRRELAQLVAYRLLTNELTLEQARAALPDVEWESVAEVDARIGKTRGATERFALSHSLPDWLAKRLLDELGGEAEAFARAINERAPLTVRTNTLKTTREALLTRLAAEGAPGSAGRFSPIAITLEGRPDVWSLPAFRDGLFEVQDEGSQLIAELVAPPPRGLVLDACAGAGGKTLAISAWMESKGRILATDVDGHKLEDLKKRARRAGLSSVQAFPTPAAAWPTAIAELSGRFDRVLVDAPCSGIGSLRRNPELRWRLDEDDVTRLTTEQESIAARTIDLLAPGGRIIYATCTVLRQENEDVVARLLAREPRLELVPIKEIWGSERALEVSDPSGTYLKTLPHRHGTDGFFAAVLRKVRER
jgi:16S rRNA (cytosine967-C5)-methyltransferase